MMFRTALFVLLTASVAIPTTTEAQQRNGVVLRFRGWRGAQARAQVVRAIQAQANLVARNDVEAVARGAGVSLDDAAGMSAVARELNLSFIVAGRVRGRGGRARVEIKIYDASGNEVAMRQGPRPVGAARMRRVRNAATEAYAQADAAIAQVEAAEAQRQREQEEERQRLLDQQMAEEPPEEDEPSTIEGGLPRLQALVGIDIHKRKADVDLGAGGGRVYRAGFYPELTIELRSFPMGNADSLLRGIYAQLDLGFAMGLSTQERDAAGNLGPEIDTSAWRLGVHVGYIYALDDDSFRVGGLFGFGIDKFTIDDNTTMPSSNYTYLRIGLVADARLYEKLLRARVDFGYRITFGVGDLVPAFGEDSSQGGFDIGIGLYGQLDMGLTYGVRFGFTRYSVDFSGIAAIEPPSAATAEDMTDKGVSLGFQVGYTL